MFDIVFLKKTGQIVRTGYFDGTLVLSEDEDSLSFDSWVEFDSKAVNVKKRILVDATEKNAFNLRGEIGEVRNGTEIHTYEYRVAQAESWDDVNRIRVRLLTETDYLMMPDYPIAPAYREKLAAYRQALRDITQQKNPDEIVWPELPTK